MNVTRGGLMVEESSAWYGSFPFEEYEYRDSYSSTYDENVFGVTPYENKTFRINTYGEDILRDPEYSYDEGDMFFEGSGYGGNVSGAPEHEFYPYDLRPVNWFENDGMVTYQFGHSRRVLQIIHIPLAVLGFLGVVGNIMSIIVWTRPQLKSSSAILLTALTSCDLLIILTNSIPDFWSYVIFLNYRSTPSVRYYNEYIYMRMLHWNYQLYYTANAASIYLTITITLERYIAVCHPFSYLGKFTCSRAYMYGAGVINFSILYNCIRFWETDVQAVFDPRVYLYSYSITPRGMFRNDLFDPTYVYSYWLQLLLMYFLPLAIVVFLNTAISRELMKRAKRERQAITESQKEENRLTMMILCTDIEFIVCTSISTFVGILGVSGKVDQLRVTIPVHCFFAIFNSSINFVTYFTIGRSFRKTLVNLLSRHRRPPHHSRPADLRDQRRAENNNVDEIQMV